VAASRVNHAEEGMAGVANPRRTLFTVALATALVVLLARSPVILVFLGWFLGPYEEVSGAGVLSHRVHEIAFGILFSWALVGALSQVRSPSRNVAGALQLILTLTIFTVVVTAATGTFELLSLLMLVPVAGVAMLHPAGKHLFRPTLEPSVALLSLAALGAPWLLSETTRELGLASARAQGHTSHWAAMASFILLLVLLSLLAALRPPGYRAIAASIGVGAILLGLAALLYPFDASGMGGWPILMAWGGTWLLVAIRTGTRAPPVGRPRLLGRLRPGARVGAALFGGLVLMVAITSSPPNVPHNLEQVPGRGSVAWSDAGRATCLTCHLTGVQGAVVVNHPTRTCGAEYDSCIEARSDCLACHRFDPALGGSTRVVEAAAGDLPFGDPEMLSLSVAAHDAAAVRRLLASLDPPG